MAWCQPQMTLRLDWRTPNTEAGHRHFTRAGHRRNDRGGLPPARDQRGDILRVEGQVRWPERLRGPAAESAGGREQQAEASSCGRHARQRRPEGSSVKKVLTPAAKRAAVAQLREVFAMSERRASGLIRADRTMVRY